MKVKTYFATRAIIMAAGYGSRMNPVTFTTPKPLVEVNGIRIIDTLIDALLAKGIDEIIIVRGYLKHRFDELLDKYPMLKFVDNDRYDKANNIYSIYLVRDYLENAYVLEADLLLSNPNIITKTHESSDFLAIKVDETDDWCFDYDEDKYITSLHKGGNDVYQEVGISFWNKEDGVKLRKHIEKAYNEDSSIFWESVPLTRFSNEYKVKIKECKKKDIVEIDSFKELCEIDSSYINSESLITEESLDNISKTLNCTKQDIKNIEYLKVGLTNSSFKFCVLDKAYVYRQPGKNTNIFINRKSEVYSESIAKDLGLDKTIIHIDESGWKLSKYLDCVLLDPYDINDQKRAMKLIKKLHNANIVSKYDFDYLKETERFIKIFKQDKIVDFSKHLETHKQVKRINKLLDSLGYTKVLCHNDFWSYNILKEKSNKLTLIDWEYSGNAYPACDVAYYVSSLDFSIDDYLSLAKLYEGHTLTNKETKYYLYSLAIVMWYWYVWALYKEANGKTIEDKQLWYDKAIAAIERLRNI